MTEFDVIDKIFEMLLRPAFSKRRPLSKRLPFILLYVILGATLVGFGAWLSLLLFSVGNLLLGITVSAISVLFLLGIVLGPFTEGVEKPKS